MFRTSVCFIAGALSLGLVERSLFAQVREQGDPADSGKAEQTVIDPDEAVELALERYDAGDPQKANTIYQELMQSKPTLPKLKLLRGLLLIYNRRGNEALGPLEEYNQTEDAKNDYRGYAAIGHVYMESRMHKMAIYPLERAQEYAPLEKNKRPVRAQIGMDLAMAYLGLKLHKKAVDQAKLSGSFAPNDADVQMRLAQIAAEGNDLNVSMEGVTKALALFQEKRREDPFNMEIASNMRSCYQVLMSLNTYKINSDPKAAENYYQYAQAQLKVSEVEHLLSLINARVMALKAIERNADKIDWQLFVVEIEHKLGGDSDARERLAGILQKHPDNKAALDLQKRLFQGSEVASSK